MYFKVDSESKKSGRRTEDPSGGGGVVIANAATSPGEVPVYARKKSVKARHLAGAKDGAPN